ncbi:MAG: WYL domain-containing protein, partial [Phenylobacterium sp.]
GALALVRTAIKSLCALRFRYDGGSTPGRVREVTPYGVLFGRSNYLVAAEDGGEARSWRLDRIGDLALVDRPAAPPDAFSLQDFADESFGIYHGAVETVVLRIAPQRAEDALAWRFHANQRVERQADGSVRVEFRAGGLLELAWHLFTWGDAVEILAPPALAQVMVEELRKALALHEQGLGRRPPAQATAE